MLTASDASAQSPTDILATSAGFEMGQKLRKQNPAFSFSRFRDGFEAGLRGDSIEIAYALGLRAGLSHRADTTTHLDPDIFIGGIEAGLRGDPPTYSQEEVARATRVHQEDLAMGQLQAQARINEKARHRLAEARQNGEASARFLAEVEARPGVRKTPSGVLYRITTPGHGASPTVSDQVEIRYVGRLADGTEFNRSPEGQSSTVHVYAVVPGFSEMLKAMTPGETRTIWIPSALAYGVLGAPGLSGAYDIPPCAALEYDVTLVHVSPAPTYEDDI